MNKKTKEYRKMIADEFIKSLQEDSLQWKKMWSGNMRPINGHTGRKYSGLNRLWLQYNMTEKNFDDPRFYTFKQVQDMGLKVKKGSKAVQVEFWSLYDPKTKKTVDFSKAAEYEDEEKELTMIARYYSVFNGSQIEGLEKYEQPMLSDAAPQEVIDKIAANMGVDILYDGGDSAYYHRIDDNIHLPKPQAFESQDAYNATVLHELAHATGASNRLNRTKGKYFGDEQYAREELVAEIASCFAQNDLGFAIESEHFNNHKAYVQGWISEISEKEEALMEAIKDAQSAADYLAENAELVKEADIDYKKEAEHMKRITYKEEEKMSPERKTIYIKANKAFVEADLQSKKNPDKTYNKVTMPKNTVIEGQEIGGYSFYPTFIYDDITLKNVVDIPWQTDKPIRLWKGEDEITVDPKELKEALNNSFRSWKKDMKQQRESKAEKGLKKEKEKEAEIE